MKVSVLIIAHNEEQHIAQCIKSVLAQTVKPDEVILVAHNSTDRTVEIAKQYPINIVILNGETGSAYARLRGMQEVQGDVVCCIDGDSIAQQNWIEVMAETLQDNAVLAGSWIQFKGSVFNTISNFFNKYKCVSGGEKATRWLWGGSFAFWTKDKEKIVESLKKGIELSAQLHLSRNPDDYWLALLMQQYGQIVVTNKTYTVHYPKELSFKEELLRNMENHRNGKIMHSYVKKVGM